MADEKLDDPLVPDSKAWKEFGVTRQTWHRWNRDEQLGLPPAIRIGERNYRRRSQLDSFKEQLFKQALADRGKKARGK